MDWKPLKLHKNKHMLFILTPSRALLPTSIWLIGDEPGSFESCRTLTKLFFPPLVFQQTSYLSDNCSRFTSLKVMDLPCSLYFAFAKAPMDSMYIHPRKDKLFFLSLSVDHYMVVGSDIFKGSFLLM